MIVSIVQHVRCQHCTGRMLIETVFQMFAEVVCEAPCPVAAHTVVQDTDPASSRTDGTVKPSMRILDDGCAGLGTSSWEAARWLRRDAPRTSLLMLLLLCLRRNGSLSS